MNIRPLLVDPRCCGDVIKEIDSILLSMSKCVLSNVRFGLNKPFDYKKFTALQTLKDMVHEVYNCNPCLKGITIEDIKYVVSKLK